MTDESAHPGGPAADTASPPSLPAAVDRATFEAELDGLRVREKAHTHEGDAIAAARRRLPMVEMNASLTLTGPHGPLTLLEAFEGRRQLIAYYFMWRPGHPAAGQCEGCTWCATQVAELSYLHSRVFETYWTTLRGVETMDNSYALMDLTVYGRQEPWEDSPAGWPQQGSYTRTNGGAPDWPPVPVWPGGRPTPQWSRLEAGRSDDLAVRP